jgi:hypothetical protein
LSGPLFHQRKPQLVWSQVVPVEVRASVSRLMARPDFRFTIALAYTLPR